MGWDTLHLGFFPLLGGSHFGENWLFQFSCGSMRTNFFFKLVKTDLGIKILFLISQFSNVLFLTNAIIVDFHFQFSQPEYQIKKIIKKNCNSKLRKFWEIHIIWNRWIFFLTKWFLPNNCHEHKSSYVTTYVIHCVL